MSFWTDANIDRLKSMWDDGQTASSIAKSMRTTRNAIIGKAHRLRLPPRKEGVNPLAKQERAARAVKAQPVKRAPQGRPIAQTRRSPAPPPRGTEMPDTEIVAAPAPARQDRTAVTFLDVQFDQCQNFLEGQPISGHGLVCGNPVEVGSKIRFCPACKLRLCDGKPSAPAPNDKTLFMFPRKRQQARAA